MNPLVSVLLPVYNGEASVRAAIESVLAQDYEPFEFVVVDNASTDDTATIIAEYSADRRMRLVRNQRTLPRLENFVKAFDSASPQSRWLKFVGDDDRLLPGCLAEMVRVGEMGERVGLVSSYYYDGERLVDGVLPAERELFEGPELLRRLLLEPRIRAAVFSPASLMVSQRAYREMGGFRTDLLHADSELFYRVLNTYDFAYAHRALTISGYHGASGQAGSTARGDTFAEAYLVRYLNLSRYDRVKLTCGEVERIKFNLVTDSVGFMLARLARGEIKAALRHLTRIPPAALLHLPVAGAYFLGLAVKKIQRGDQFKLFGSTKKGRADGGA